MSTLFPATKSVSLRQAVTLLMHASTSERIVVSVGGSLIVPDHIDTDFLSRLRTFVLDKIHNGFSFSIVAGGGKTARKYQEAADAVVPLGQHHLDWIGIHATRLNAHLLKNIFHEFSHPEVIEDPTIDHNIQTALSIVAGWKPGWSTDYCAVMMAKNIGASRIINLSNRDYVYDDDPKKNPLAKPIVKINWHDFRSLIPTEWSPGLSSPFDPIAACEAELLGLEVAIINGMHIDEVSNYIEGKPFVGTVIS